MLAAMVKILLIDNLFKHRKLQRQLLVCLVNYRYYIPNVLQKGYFLAVSTLNITGLGFYRVERYFYPTMGRNRVNTG